MSAYPDGVRARNAWVVARRGPKTSLDPFVPYGVLGEEEIDARGRLRPSVVVLITNRECPLRCVFCDLWQNTLDARVPKGAIAAQVRSALARVPGALQAKLYNAGSFFDPNAIPVDEYGEIADALGPVEHVVVESHPSFVGERALRFRDVMGARTLEVAIGLETVEPGVLERLNKGMTVRSFERAAAFLEREGIGLRVFVMLQPPFSSVRESVAWACRSIDAAAAAGAAVCTVIPTRVGDGAMVALGASVPGIRSLERVVEYGLARGGLRVFADVWDVERQLGCACGAERIARLARMNREQRVAPAVECERCDEPGEHAGHG